MINGEHKQPKFKDRFFEIACNHGLMMNTRKTYWFWARSLILWAKIKSAKELENNPQEMFTRYLSKLANDGVAASTQNQAWNALMFLFEKVIGIELGEINGVVRATRQERFIEVPEPEQAKRIVESVSGNAGLALRLIYGTAMRVNDCLRLRVKDLVFERQEITVNESKGGTARIVPMPESLIPELKILAAERERLHEQDLANGHGWVWQPGKLAKKYPGTEKSIGWQYLFAAQSVSKDPETGNMGRHHLLDVSLQRAMRQARKRLRFKRRYTVHGLRHAAAQFWERNSVTTSDIQKLLGHRNVETTMRYLKSGKLGAPKVPSPI